MYRTEAKICQNFYWPNIRDSIRKEVTNCDTCQRTRRQNKKYGKILAKLSEEIPWNKLYVDNIEPYIIRLKGRKEILQIKSVTTIDTITGWFEVVRYDDKRAITIAILV